MARRLEHEILVDYNADLEFIFKAEHIKVPENLLKSRDLTRTYENAVAIAQINDVSLSPLRDSSSSKGRGKSKSPRHSRRTDN